MSIKSKLLTAVTTAGLLASLFGTALLPVAQAAASVVDADSLNVKSTDTDLIANIGGGVYHVKAGKTISIEGQFDVTDADGVSVSATVSGTTIAGNTGTVDVPLASIAGNMKSINFGFLDNVSNWNVEFTVLAPAAGATATVTLDDETIVLVGLAANAVGTPYSDGTNNYTWLMASCHSQDSDGMGGGGAACSDTDYIEEGGYIAYQMRNKDVYDTDITAGYFVTASVTGGVGGVEVNQSGGNNGWSNHCSGDDESTSDKAIVDAAMDVCFTSDGTASKPVTLTVTVGSITFTRKIGVLGDVATLALTAPTAIATIGDTNLDDVPEAWGDSFAVVAKDSAGNIIGNGGGEAADFSSDGVDAKSEDAYMRNTHEDGEMGFASDINFVVTDSNGVDLGFDTEDSYVCYYGDNSDLSNDDCNHYIGGETTSSFEDEGAWVADGAYSYSYAEQGNGVYTVPTTLCDLGDEGETRKVKVTGGSLDLISSNVVTVKCVEDAVKLSGATQSVTSGVKNSKVKFSFTATDGAGAPVGDGATASVGWTASWGDEDTCDLEFAGGAATCSVTLDPAQSGLHYVILSVTDNDPATTGSQTWAEKYNVSVTNAADVFTASTFYKSKVKPRAVVIFPGAAGKTVEFTVENARTGQVRSYYRKANASGKAWYTIPARGTYYVTAFWGANITDTIRIVK